MVTLRTDGNSWIASDSGIVNGGLLRHLHVSSESSQASNVMGKRLTKNVVGPARSNSAVTPVLMPWIAAEMITTTNTPIAMPRIVRAARTLFARNASIAITTPSPSGLSLVSTFYSLRRDATGSSREARLAGYTPAMIPTPIPTPTRSEEHTSELQSQSNL